MRWGLGTRLLGKMADCWSEKEIHTISLGHVLSESKEIIKY